MSNETRNPYVGPRTFEREDAPYFFGREREAQDLLFLVLSQRLVLFYAQSGAGKSSLLNTRLRPGLESEGFRVLPTGRVSGQLPKGVQPQDVHNIFAFNLLLALDEGRVPAAQLQHTTLLDYFQQAHPVPDDKTPTVLLIDQFEEIITTHQERWTEREGFFQQLQTAMDQDSRLWVVLTLREDYVAALDSYARLLPGRLRSRYHMQRMNAAAALEAIESPAQKAGRPFAPGVAQQLVDNLRQLGGAQPDGEKSGSSENVGFPVGLGEFVEPVQLQVVCQRLWASLGDRPQTVITAEDLVELGDVNTALADFYEQVLSQTEQETGVNRYLLRTWVDKELITEGGTRGTVDRGQNNTGGLPNAAVDSLTRQFLLRQEPRAGGIWYELIHDRFIAPIQQANQKWREAQSPLYQAAMEWERTGRKREKLYQGELLQESLQSENWESLPHIVKEFLNASRDAQSQHDLKIERQRAAAEARTNRRLRWLTASLVVAVLVAAVLAVLAFGERNRATAEARDAAAARVNAENNAQEALTQQAQAIAAQNTAQAGAVALATSEAGARDNARLAEIRAAEAAMAQATAEASRNETARLSQQIRAVQLAAQAELALDNDPELGLMLAVAAVNSYQDEQGRPLPQAQRALYLALASPYQSVLYGHTGTVRSASFSPDGQQVLTASEDGTARLWDTQTGAELAVLAGHTDWVYTASFSPDGQQIVTASLDGTARLWDTRTGAQLAVLAGHTIGVNSASFSPNGQQVVTASGDGTARLWNAQTGAQLAILAGHTDWIYSASFSPDGSQVVTASGDGTARLWDVETGTELAVFVGHTEWVSVASFSPNGQRVVTASGDGTARLWNAQTGAQLAVLTGHTGWVYVASFSPDGLQVMTASFDRTARLWNAQTGAELAMLVGHTSSIDSASFSPNGQRVVTASGDGTARLWDSQTGTQLAVFAGHTEEIYTASFSQDGLQVVTASGDGTARLWDAQTGDQLTVITGHTAEVLSASFSPNGLRVLTASYDGTARLWDAQTGVELTVLARYPDGLSSASFSPDGAQVVTASLDGTARLWDAQTGAERAVLVGHMPAVLSASFSPDGLWVVTSSSDGTARLWDAGTGIELAVFVGHTDWVYEASFSPDGLRVVTASSDWTARLWEAQTGTELAVLVGHTNEVTSASFSSDGQQVITTSYDRTARLWDVATGAELVVFVGHTNGVTSANFSPDGQRVVTTSIDGTARLWDVASGAELAVFVGHTSWVNAANFSPDGLRVVTASSDGTIRIWRVLPYVSIEEMMAEAAHRLSRGFTETECQRYFREDLTACTRVAP